MQSVENIYLVYDNNKESDRVGELVGKAMLEEANNLKGLMQKTAQLMGDRPDLVGNQEICSQLRILQSECPTRPKQQILDQISIINRFLETIPSSDETVPKKLKHIETVKAGTIGEVSKVLDPATGAMYALKTINPESKRLFEADFDMFNSIFLNVIKRVFDNLPDSLAKQTKAVLDNLYNSVANPAFKKHIMDEFDLRKEKGNLEEAARAAHQAMSGDADPEKPEVKVMVPKPVWASEDGASLLVHWVDGKNITDYASGLSEAPSPEVQRALLSALVTYYFKDLCARKRLHMDLHPGNIIIQSVDCGLHLWVIDIGDELRPSSEEVASMRKLLNDIHSDKPCSDWCGWKELGVESKKEGNKQYEYFSKCFDLISGMEGLNFEENAEHIKYVVMPDQVVLWQKATNAFVMTLQTLRGKFPEWQQPEAIRTIIRGSLSKALADDTLMSFMNAQQSERVAA